MGLRKIISMLLIAVMMLGTVGTAFADTAVYQLNINPVQASYGAGGTIAISGNVLKDSVGEADVDVLLSMEDKSSGSQLWAKQLKTGADGSFDTVYQIEGTAAGKNILIKVQACDQTQLMETSIDAANTPISQYDIILNPLLPEYNAGGIIEISGIVKDGETPAANAAVLIDIADQVSGGQLWAGQAATGADGSFSKTYQISGDAPDKNILIRVQSCDITKTAATVIKAAVGPEPVYELAVNNLLPQYNAGETILVSGIVKVNGAGKAEIPVKISIENSSGGSIWSRTVPSQQDGSFSSSYTIPSNTADKSIVIKVEAGGAVQTFPSFIKAVVISHQYQIVLNNLQSSYTPGSTIVIGGSVKKDGMGEGDADVLITVERKQDGNKLFTKQVKTLSNGSFSCNYLISSDASNQELVIRLTSCGVTATAETSIASSTTAGVSTDKSSYYRGATVSISGYLRYANGNGLGSTAGTVTVYYGTTKKLEKSITTSASGTFTTSYVLGNSADYGTYTVKAVLGGKTAETTFAVVQTPTGGGGVVGGASGSTTTTSTEDQIKQKLKALESKTGDAALADIISILDANSTLSVATSTAIIDTLSNVLCNKEISLEKAKEAVLKAIEKTIGNAILQSKDEVEKAELKEKLVAAINCLVKKAAVLQGTALKLQENGSKVTVTVDSSAAAKALDNAEAVIKEVTSKLKLKGLEAMMANVGKAVHVILPAEAIAKGEVIIELDSSTAAKLKAGGATLVLETKGVALRLQTFDGTTLQFVSKAIDSSKLAQLKNSADRAVSGKLRMTAALQSLSFTGAPVVEMPVTASMLQGFDVDKLGIYAYNESASKWEYLNTRYDAQRKVLIAKAAAPGIYAALEYSRSFGDIASHWGKTDIEKMAAKYITEGIGNNNFGPNNIITRAEFATWIVRALGLSGSGKTQFADVDGKAWYAAAVSLAADNGIIKAEAGNKFRPTDKMTREEMAVMTANAYKLLYNKTLVGKELTYKDKAEISTAALEAVKGLTQKGIMQGSNGNFMPRSNTTRAEAIVVLKRILNN